ncbi:Uncharacterized P-loop hydrolase [Archaeoglobus fulgidus DSM 8774]|uniref:Uncharacterized P-loop hydrolase n=1 Tax=Archaeoglobus fulgidus DSM 8774 TaxID=1344584 RepID=A0A075WH15_ARCFL|nr:hypothetical protein [Archaeoglobus fulgidus]AIG98389.1 Uncharacterized P-loop hydrolase [Archaeoglobus fulgidus DSM 8774]
MLQLDVWRPPSTITPFLTVISHSHADHIPKNTADIIVIHKYWADRPNVKHVKPIIADGKPIVFKPSRSAKIVVKALTPREVGRIAGRDVRRLHSTWWPISYDNQTILFIGDLDAGETEIVKEFIEGLEKSGTRITKLAIPSYNGVNGHNSEGMQLAREVADLTRYAKAKGITTIALPHPVLGPGSWDEVWIRSS